MITNRTMVFQTQSFTEVLKYTDFRSYTITAVFILFSVALPWVLHQFQLAGATFLPMHIFILIAGFTYGWRAGLIVGICTPIASYAISGMPLLAVLPQITIELSVYGIAAGILHEKFQFRTIWSLLGAMLAGRIALFLVMLITYLMTGASHGLLGIEANPASASWSVIKQGWPGIIIQLALIPAVIAIARKYYKTK